MIRTSHVAICGGGVAGIEALLALREILDVRPHIDLVAPDPDFVYTPMAVAEPFGLSPPRRFDLGVIAQDLGAELHVGSLARLDTENSRLELDDGSAVPYDAAIVAVGARPTAWLQGALCFGGPRDTGAFQELLSRIADGRVSSVAFTAPAGASWTLPMYELALLTSSRLAELGPADVEITIVTPEEDPLGVFGAGASRMLRSQLADRGIHLRTGAMAESLSAGSLLLSSGTAVDVDEVVTMPRLEGPRVPGLPATAEGFIPIDRRCRVAGLDNVYAAGDGTDFPVKQGGLASQQADVAAEWVARGLGAARQPALFEPMLKGLLLTGLAPIYMRAAVRAGTREEGEVAADALWWPPGKIAGRYLGPYLAFVHTSARHGSLEDRPASTSDLETQRAAQQEARELGLAFAEADARSGDFQSAIGWLELVEQINGVLPTDYIGKREEWLARQAQG